MLPTNCSLSRPGGYFILSNLLLLTLLVAGPGVRMVYGSTVAADAVPADSEAAAQDSQQPGEWISLFNGKDLTGWIPKIRYSPIGENYGETFRVEDGLLKVVYDAQAYPMFGQRFGHLFFHQPYSQYRLRVEYRFVGEQCAGGPGWAVRNNGLMLHCEDPAGMDIDQDFPASIEYQLLGGDGRKERPTANVCTPGTNIVLDGKLHLPHCTTSTAKTYHGDQWVIAEVEVRGSDVIRHIMEGQVVLEYHQPQLDDRDPHSKKLIEQRGGQLLVNEGWIAIQAESHPIEFRRIELMILD
jgi:hypothetical protein